MFISSFVMLSQGVFCYLLNHRKKIDSWIFFYKILSFFNLYKIQVFPLFFLAFSVDSLFYLKQKEEEEKFFYGDSQNSLKLFGIFLKEDI